MSDLLEFHRELILDVQGNADAEGQYTSEAFFERLSDLLCEAGEIDAADYAYFEGTGRRGATLQVDGYGGDPSDAQDVLSLILCDFRATDEVRQVRAADLKSRFDRLTAFLRHATDPNFREQLEETSAGFMLADLIATRWKSITKVKLIVITNAEKRTKADGVKAGTIGDRPVTYTVWDLVRIQKYMVSAQTREDLEVDFEGDFGSAVPVLKASRAESGLESYIAVIRGDQLGEIYERWGTRLLEANVRSFLQARGKVNRGIRDTLEDQPEMFFAYNNGITATANSVDIRDTPDGPMLVSAFNLQIVNGGQTTASIHAARKQRPKRSKARLEDVYVQMKLNVVPPEKAEEIIPSISLYANSQNKVNDADLSSNHPFQIRMQSFSRRILAPKGEEAYQETKWFYERARGQYPDERGRRTPAERKKFDLEYPRSQYFTKTDLAKFVNSWEGSPHVVSQGAQKNFIAFAREIAKAWQKSDARFDETWFRRAIAKAIIFRRLEVTVPQQIWYEGGYRANIVTYAIAKVAHDFVSMNIVVDLDRVWRLQRVPEALEASLLIAAAEAHSVITSPPAGIRNMSEWAKKQACWAALQQRRVDYPDDLEDFLVSSDEAAMVVREQRNDRTAISAIEAQTAVVELGADFWKRALSWAKEHRSISAKEAGILDTCGSIPRRLPSEKQSLIAMEILGRIEAEGFEGRTHSSEA